MQLCLYILLRRSLDFDKRHPFSLGSVSVLLSLYILSHSPKICSLIYEIELGITA